MRDKFLPISMEDVKSRGWDSLDFIVITGDAYVDHPSFGAAIIGRMLESKGFRVGIIAQPDWRDVKNFKVLGKPRLGFLITAGNIDSMVNHYSVSKHRRKTDFYSPGGQMGLRPDRATIVYSNKIKEAYRKVPIIIGGIEASLRRFAHYDYWDNKVRRSILIDSMADLLIYGMAEKQIVEVAEALDSGLKVEHLVYLKGTCYVSENLDAVHDSIELPSFEDVSADKVKYAKAFKVQNQEQEHMTGKSLVQRHGDKYLVQNAPPAPLKEQEMDQVYSLPFQRDYHPIYKDKGGIPAIEEVKFSIIGQRGCYGGCSFCALTFHQGRVIQARSKESIISEAKKMIWEPDFKGYIHDVGGPTANFTQVACDKQTKHGVCKEKQCMFPKPCSNLKIDHSQYLDTLRELRQLPNVKKVFIRSGIRYDYLMADKNDEFFKELCEHHVSGQLKVAPEHISRQVLDKMGKPGMDVYGKFVEKFYKINKDLKKEQYLVPYLMSSHPGSDLHAAIELAEYIRDLGYNPEQVQDFYPTPGSLSTTMFYTGINPMTMEKVYVPKDPKEKAMQRALIQYRNPKNYHLVHEALVKANREDLIGYGKKCLIKPIGDVIKRQKLSRDGKTGVSTGKTRKETSSKARGPKGTKAKRNK
jgi:uncharacterized radical SAM protein YgiQ